MSDESTLDLLPDGALVADDAGVVVAANVAAAHLLGVPVLVGSRLADLPLQDNEGRDWYACAAPYDGLTTRSGIPEQSWLLPDGTEVLITARLHRAARGAPVSSVALALRSGRGRARLDRDRSDLVATVAHELRSPLTGVRGFVSTLLSRWGQLNDDQKKLMLTTVNADSERLTQLITELLDVARIDTGRLPLYPREVDLDALVERTLATMRTTTHRVIEYDAATPGRALVHADPDKLTQVLTNLVENALRHGEGVVHVRTERTGERTRLVIEDEGEGIPPALRRRAVTKFWRQGTRGGTGLGLYIVNGLVRAHGGELDIGDAPGGGARLEISLPTP